VKISEVDILLLPDLGGAGPGHWLRRWAERFGNGRMLEQESAERPQRAEWLRTIETGIMMATRPVVLVAHGLAVSAVVHVAQRLVDTKVRGAFLVAPPDHENGDLPPAARAMGDVPRDPLPFPSMLVASTDDRSCSIDSAVDLATAWGAELHLARNAGHIDLKSGHGPWPEGLLIFTRLMQRLR
jgi:predicted alpha/beta hydrolase family esterase